MDTRQERFGIFGSRHCRLGQRTLSWIGSLVIVASSLPGFAPTALKADENATSPDKAATAALIREARLLNPLERIFQGDEGQRRAAQKASQAPDCMVTGDFIGAAQCYREAERLSAESLGAEHHLTRALRSAAVEAEKCSQLPEKSRHEIVQAVQLGRKGSTLYSEGETVAAMDCFREAIPIFRSLLGTETPLLIHLQAELGLLQTVAWELDASRETLKSVLPLAKGQFGDDHPAVAIVLLRLATAYSREGLLEPAIETLQHALAIYESLGIRGLVGTEQTNCLGVHFLLACLHNDRDEGAQALRVARRGLREWAASPEPDESTARLLTIEIGRSLSRLNRTAEADAVFSGLLRQIMFEGSAEPGTRDPEANSQNTVLIRSTTAWIEHLRHSGRVDDANVLQVQIEAILKRPLPDITRASIRFGNGPLLKAPASPQSDARVDVIRECALEMIQTRTTAATIKTLARGQVAQAAVLAGKAANEFDERFGPSDSNVRFLRPFAAACERASQLEPVSQERISDAYSLFLLAQAPTSATAVQDILTYHRDAMELLEEALPADDFLVLGVLRHLGAFEMVIGDDAAARAHLTRVIQGFERILGADHPFVGSTQVWLGKVELKSNELALAEDWTRRGLAVVVPACARGYAREVEALVEGQLTLSEIHRRRGEATTALSLAESAATTALISKLPPGLYLKAQQQVLNSFDRDRSQREIDSEFDGLGRYLLREYQARRLKPAYLLDFYTAYADHLDRSGRSELAQSLRNSASSRFRQGAPLSPSSQGRVKPAGGVAL